MNSSGGNGNAENCKVVLVGETGVGKTSIISRFCNNKFDSVFMPTPGASFTSKSLYIDEYDKIIKFEIWDTAGQEKYRSLSKIFYKDAQVAILVYDITRKSSFEEIQKFWMNQVVENSNKKISLSFIYVDILIVGNKSDLFEIEEIDEVTVKNFAKDNNAIFKLVSAMNANGIDDVFYTIGKVLLDPNTSLDRSDSVRKNSIRVTGSQSKDFTNGNSGGGCCLII